MRTTEQLINEFVEDFQQASIGHPYVLDTDKLLNDFGRRLINALPHLDMRTIGEVLVHLAAEQSDMTVHMTDHAYPAEEHAPIVINTAGIVGSRLVRTAELGADWPTTTGDPE